MEQNYICYDLGRNSKCRWSDNQLYRNKHTTNSQYKHIYAYDGNGRIACFTARVPSNKIQKAPSQHKKEVGYNELKEVLQFYKPPEISSYAIHPPESSSKVKYDTYPTMYAKHKVDHNALYKESCIDENVTKTGRGKHSRATDTPYSFLFCSDYIKQRMDRKIITKEEAVRDNYYKSKELLVKPETRDISCGNFSIRKKLSSTTSRRLRLKRVNTSKRIKRFVIYKRVCRTMKELEHLFKVSKSKWEMVMANASEEFAEENVLNEIEPVAEISGLSMTSASEVKIVMTTSHTAITPFDVDIPKTSESSPAISSSITPLKAGSEIEELPAPTSNETKVTEASQTVQVNAKPSTISQVVATKDVATECYLKRKRRKSALRATTIDLMCDLSTIFLKELQNAIYSIPAMSYFILVTFYALP